jgi:hypothetical protein
MYESSLQKWDHEICLICQHMLLTFPKQSIALTSLWNATRLLALPRVEIRENEDVVVFSYSTKENYFEIELYSDGLCDWYAVIDRCKSKITSTNIGGKTSVPIDYVVNVLTQYFMGYNDFESVDVTKHQLNKTPVLFLDFDGVLCLDGMRFDSQTVKNLERILQETNCDIVVSSSWKQGNPCWQEDVISSCSLCSLDWMKKIIGCTPDLMVCGMYSKTFGIETWLKQNDCHTYVIVDDEEMSNTRNFVKTDPNFGLNAEAMNQVIHQFTIQCTR